MIQNILRHLGGIEQYGLVSLCLFISLFTAIFLWALLQKKRHLDYMARVPLTPDHKDSPNEEPTHE